MKLFTPHWGSTSVKLADLLKSQEKQDLVYSAYSLHLSVSEKLKTNDFAETLAKEVLTSANKWVGGLPQYDLMFLSKLVDAGPNNFVEEPNLLPVSMLQLSSIIICEECSDEKECRRFMICDELREAVAPYVHAELHSEKNAQRFVFEKYVLGLMNLYGAVTVVDLFSLLSNFSKKEITDDVIMKRSFGKSLFLHRYIQDEESATGLSMFSFVSPYLFDYNSLKKSMDKRPELEDLKSFSEEEVCAAGDILSPQIPCPYNNALKEYLVIHLACSEPQARNMILMFWYFIQKEETDLLSLIYTLVEDKPHSDDLQELMTLFINYSNHSPCWYLNGYSPNEIKELNQN